MAPEEGLVAPGGAAAPPTSTAELGAVGPPLGGPLVGGVLRHHVVLDHWVHAHHVLVGQVHVLVPVQLHLRV